MNYRVAALLGSVFMTGAGAFQAFSQTGRPGYIVYSTGFEQSEGYDPRYALAAPGAQGQGGWAAEGTGGNGLISRFPGLGQQAYIGFFPPLDTNAFTSVWRPLNMPALPPDQPIVKFSTLMQIVPSDDDSQDDFRWSVYNSAGDRLFSIDFEGSTHLISYVLDDGQFVETGFDFTYDPEGVYELSIVMDTLRNRWTATLNDEVLASGLRMTTIGKSLAVGDVDAVWAVRDPAKPGNNYMAFDNYTIAVEPEPTIPPSMQERPMQADGVFRFDLYGTPGLKYEIDVTEDFVNWSSLGVYDVDETGAFIFEDTTSPGYARGFYRAIQVP